MKLVTSPSNLKSLFFLLIFPFGLEGQVATGSLNDHLETHVFNDPLLKHSVVTASAIDIQTGKFVHDKNAEISLIPASSQKLIPNFVALDLLGPEFQFETILSYTGEILDDGTLTGDLVIRGGSDPTLGSSKFDGNLNFEELLAHWVRTIRSAGIRCMDGVLIVDISNHSGLSVSPSWQFNDLGNYYASGSWGINIHDNEYTISFASGERRGAATRINKIEPFVPHLTLDNRVTTGDRGSGDQAYIFGAPFQNQRRIFGTIPPGHKSFEIRGSLPDPPYFLAFHLSRELEISGLYHQGFEVRREGKNHVPGEIILDRRNSMNLKEMIAFAHDKSDNLITDALISMLGKQSGGKASMQKGIETVTDYLSKIGLDLRGIHMEDGSGLSARNRISSASMVHFLEHMWKENNGQDLLQFLPLAGRAGTVANILKDSDATGSVWVKSGSMSGVMSYSGYIQNRDKSWFSFCIIINGTGFSNAQVRTLIDEYLLSLYKWTGSF